MEKTKKIVFILRGDNLLDVSTESLWAEKIRDNIYRLKNIPFLAFGVSYSDEIQVKKQDKQLIFDSVIRHSGHSTYRIYLKNETCKDNFNKYWEPLKDIGCTYESYGYELPLYAIDVPPKTDIYKVYKLLEKGSQNNVWDFEEGYMGHKLKKTLGHNEHTEGQLLLLTFLQFYNAYNGAVVKSQSGRKRLEPVFGDSPLIAH